MKERRERKGRKGGWKQKKQKIQRYKWRKKKKEGKISGGRRMSRLKIIKRSAMTLPATRHTVDSTALNTTFHHV